VLRRLFGPKKREVTRGWRKLHEELQVKEDEMGGACSRNGEEMNAYRLLVGKPEGKRMLGRPRRRWVNNVRMDLVEVGLGDVDRIGLTEDRNTWIALINLILNLRVP
jgi:hypothetical protein